MKKKLGIIIVILIAGAIAIPAVLLNQQPNHQPGNNVTCKKQDHGNFELCVQGVTNPVIVPYATWRSARVGGYYDTGTEEVYGDVNEDPQVNPPAENNGGDQGGEQGGDQGGGGEGGGEGAP